MELAYMVVIPQKDGHAIITACESEKRFIPDIASIHCYMPKKVNPKEPYRAYEGLRKGLSRKIWMLNEIGLKEALYQTWSETERDKVTEWMKKRMLTHSELAPGDLPPFF